MAIVGCDAPAANGPGTASGVSSLGDGDDDEEDESEDEGSEDGDGDGQSSAETLDPDDDGGTSTTGLDGGAEVTTAFETLTTDPTIGATTDPTNTSAVTNDTGTALVPIVPTNIIDDLEDGDAVILEQPGRIGIWYAYGDPSSATLNPPAVGNFVTTAGGPNGSKYSSILRGGGFTQYVGFGFDINNSGGTTKRPFDASMFTGIAFQARGSGTVLFKIQTQGVVPATEGGTCVPAPAPNECNDSYSFRVTLTPQWTQVVVPFAMMAQDPYWGLEVPWNPATVVGLQWEMNTTTVTTNPFPPFEIAIDDIGFY
jgi:hypothetical protein